jgi:hypothetical protein
MADYQLTATDVVYRVIDATWIPPDPANLDYAAYLAWVDDGGVPDPYVPPEIPPAAPTQGQELAFNHENRILALEGLPPLTMEEFISKAAPG